jgi:hypothetical protein
MDDDGVKEMVVGWQMSASVRLLTIYSVRDFQISPLLSTNYEKYSLADLNAESGKNVIVYRSAPEEGAPEVEAYSLMQDGEITSATARLSEGVTTIVSIKQGKLLENRQAVFVDSEYADGGLITDILVSEKSDELLNVTLGMTAEEARARCGLIPACTVWISTATAAWRCLSPGSFRTRARRCTGSSTGALTGKTAPARRR